MDSSASAGVLGSLPCPALAAKMHGAERRLQLVASRLVEGPLRKPGKMNEVTGATAVAPGANQGLNLNCKLLVAGLCLYGSLQCTACMHAGSGRTAATHTHAGAQWHQKRCATAAFG